MIRLEKSPHEKPQVDVQPPSSNEPEPVEDAPPPVLEYGHPDRPISTRRIFAGLFGILAALFSLLAVPNTAYFLISALNDRGADRVHEFWNCGVTALISLVCGWAAVRWGRQGFNQ